MSDQEGKGSVARTILLALSVATLLAASAYGIARGEVAFAVGFAILGAAAILFALAAYARRVAPSRFVSDSVAIDTSLDRALELTTDAVRQLQIEGEVNVDSAAREVSIHVPRTWLSFGERVAASVQPSGGSILVTVTSQSVRPTLIDYGRNRRNVTAVLDSISFGSVSSARRT